MKPVWRTCRPREEVLTGRLKEDIFAAKLGDVIRAKAPDVYSDAATFFENTYDTAGLKTLLAEIFGRLSARGGSPFIRLETSFGGGKTHNLIAAYHIARRGGDIPGLERFLPRDVVPAGPVNVAGVVGQELDPINGVKHGKLTVHTVWGEIAYQLGGKDGFSHVARSDEQFAAPGTDALAQVVGDSPTLIMIDELAHHLRVARKQPGLHEQVAPFLGALIELASSRPNLVLVVTLAGPQDAYAKETDEVREALREIGRIRARQERSLTPTSEAEIASVINHRLFHAIDTAAAQEAADAYHQYYQKLHDRGVAIPEHAVTAEYANEIERTYPFHPALIDVLNLKTSTIPNFQRTRGVLRLLAHIIRRVWEAEEPDAYLIAPHHVELSVDAIREELTSRLDRQEFVPVIQADIYSEKKKAKPAHAQALDAEWQQKAKPPYGKRVAQTVFIHSLTHGKAKWATRADINLSVCQPDTDPDLIDQTIGRLGSFWHIHEDEQRDAFYFDTEPSPAKIIDEEMDRVGRTEGKTELSLRVEQIYQTHFLEPVFFPEEPSGVDDNADRPKLAIMDYDSVQVRSDDDPPPPIVRNIYERKGTQGAFRTYQNNLLFLCVSAAEVEEMLRAARRYRALHRIVDSADRLEEFDANVQKKLKAEAGKADLGLRVAVTKGYRHLFFPEATAGPDTGGLKHYAFRPQEGGTDAKQDVEASIIKVLRQLRKALAADDEPLGATYVMDKLWPGGTEQMSTEGLRQQFCKKRAMPILLAPDKLKQTIRDGIENGVWVYWDGQRGYAEDHPLPAIAISEDHMIYLPEAAPFCPKCGQQPCACVRVCPRCGKHPCECPEVCPLCGKSPCECGEVCPKCGQKKPCACERRRILGPFEGTPNKVVADLRDACQDGQVSRLSGVTLVCEDVGTLRRLSLAFSQLAGLTLNVEHSYTGESKDGSVELRYRGLWAGFDSSQKFTEGFWKRATDSTQRTMITVRFEEPVSPGGKELSRMLESFNAVEVGKIELAGRPATLDEEAGGGE